MLGLSAARYYCLCSAFLLSQLRTACSRLFHFSASLSERVLRRSSATPRHPSFILSENFVIL
nr:MAG TPA: hypothetical protein [Caudoviricetes sp.]